MRTKRSLEERFWAKVRKTEGCWLWTGARQNKGYGYFWFNHKTVLAHRFAYNLLVGPIEPGKVIDHKCRRTECVRPDHLDVTTNRENVLRGISFAAQNARKTHCKNGHKYTTEDISTYQSSKYGRLYTQRRCQTCDREWHRRYCEARKAGATRQLELQVDR